MDTPRFNDRDCFTLLDLEACFDFKTETSISFQLGRYSRSRSAFSIRGWLDLHHPVHTPYGTKAYLRIALPSQYLQFEHESLLSDQLKEIVATVLKALEIPSDEVYEAHFFTPDNQQYLFIKEPGIMYSYRRETED
jgi:hypothetical protein